MLELGPQSAAMHESLDESLVANRIDRVFCCGPNMRRLYDRLPAAMRGAHAKDSAELEVLVRADVRAGDAVSVKGSLGSKMGRIVDALLALDVSNAQARRAAGGRQS